MKEVGRVEVALNEKLPWLIYVGDEGELIVFNFLDQVIPGTHDVRINIQQIYPEQFESRAAAEYRIDQINMVVRYRRMAMLN